MAELFGKLVCFELEMTTQQCRQERENGVIWGENIRCYNVKAYEDWLAVKAKGFVERLVLKEHIKRRKHEENVQFGDDNILGNMVQLPMTQFVSEHG